MIKRLILFIVLLLQASLLSASISPSDADGLLNIKNKSYWFGKVELSRAYINENNETVIEWFCHKYEVIGNVPYKDIGKLITKVEVAESNSSHFVVTIRSPGMPLETAEKAAKETTETTHFVSWLDAEIAYEGLYLDKKAFYLGGGSGIITDKIKVVYVK